MQKIREIPWVVFEKTALQTNQPIITNNTDFIGPRWRRSKKTMWFKIFKNGSSKICGADHNT